MSYRDAMAAQEKPPIPQTHCTRCKREINGTEPRVCCFCLTSLEKMELQYGCWQAYVGGHERSE